MLLIRYEPDDRAAITLHNWDEQLYGNCTMPSNITQYFNGSGTMYDGSSQLSPHGTGLAAFNNAGGGVYVMQWDHGRFIREWTFTKPNIPMDILNVNTLETNGEKGVARSDIITLFRATQIPTLTLGACQTHIFPLELTVILRQSTTFTSS